MCPPKDCRIVEISAFWTDEEVTKCLESIQRSPEEPLPHNVTDDINPYRYQPSNLPEGIWYLVHSKDPKQAEVGFWEARGDPCQIYSNSSVIGSRTTLEFHEGRSPNGHLTNWVMQEYSISHKGPSMVKGNTSLCRVFHSGREGETQKMDRHRTKDDRGQNNLLHDKDNKSVNPLMIELQAMFSHQGENPLQADCFATGDFLELQDLIDDPQPSSHSHQGENPLQADCVPTGDFLELQDLADDPQPSSRSHQGENPLQADCVPSGDFLQLQDLLDDPHPSSPSHQEYSLLQVDCVATGDFLELQDLLDDSQPSSPSDLGDNLLQADRFATGDYLELLAYLDDPQPSSSSSENSSCVSQSSDVYFDSDALLQEPEREDEVYQTKPSSHKYSISKPNDKAVSLVVEGSPVIGTNKIVEPIKVEGSMTSITAHDKHHNPKDAKKSPTPNLPPISTDSGASSSSQKSGADKGKKVDHGKMFRKFFCFIA